MKEINFKKLRKRMVSEQIEDRGIRDSGILKAFAAVPRHLFVPHQQRNSAYTDCPLDIGQGQTISQPYMAALMTKALNLECGMSVLEIGTGSGYQAAVLLSLGAKVYSVERFSVLAEGAQRVFESLGKKVAIKIGDGTMGWPEHSPYDRIIVTAAAPRLPELLIKQLKIGGKMVIPVGERLYQRLMVINRVSKEEIDEEEACGCMFVPLVGKYGYKE